MGSLPLPPEPPHSPLPPLESVQHRFNLPRLILSLLPRASTLLLDTTTPSTLPSPISGDKAVRPPLASFVRPRSSTAVLPWPPSLDTAFSPTSISHGPRLLPERHTLPSSLAPRHNGTLYPWAPSGRYSLSFLHLRCGMNVEVETCPITPRVSRLESTLASNSSETMSTSFLTFMIHLVSARR